MSTGDGSSYTEGYMGKIVIEKNLLCLPWTQTSEGDSE